MAEIYQWAGRVRADIPLWVGGSLILGSAFIGVLVVACTYILANLLYQLCITPLHAQGGGDRLDSQHNIYISELSHSLSRHESQTASDFFFHSPGCYGYFCQVLRHNQCPLIPWN